MFVKEEIWGRENENTRKVEEEEWETVSGGRNHSHLWRHPVGPQFLLSIFLTFALKSGFLAAWN